MAEQRDIEASVALACWFASQGVGIVEVAGKRAVAKEWPKTATLSPATIRARIQRQGGQYGLKVLAEDVIGLDIDHYDRFPAELLPAEAVTVFHGEQLNGKRHLWARLPAGFDRSRIAPTAEWGEVATLEQRQLVGPGSLHEDGTLYRIDGQLPAELPTLPLAAVEALWPAQGAATGFSDDAGVYVAGMSRHEFLKTRIVAFRKARMPKERVMDAVLAYASQQGIDLQRPRPIMPLELQAIIDWAYDKTAPGAEPLPPVSSLDILTGDQIPELEPVAPLLGLVAAGAGDMSVLFGDGGVGKGTLASWIVAQLTRQGMKVLVVDAEDHRQEWRRRVAGFGGDMAGWWHWRQPPAQLQLPDLPFDLSVVDSAAYFKGDDDEPWGPAAATAMQRLAGSSGKPMLVLAHVALGKPQGRAYGGAYWHNVPRVTLELADKEGEVSMTCRKATDQLGLAKGMAWHVGVTYVGLVPVDLELLEQGHDDVDRFVATYRDKEQLMERFGWSEPKVRREASDRGWYVARLQGRHGRVLYRLREPSTAFHQTGLWASS